MKNRLLFYTLISFIFLILSTTSYFLYNLINDYKEYNEITKNFDTVDSSKNQKLVKWNYPLLPRIEIGMPIIKKRYRYDDIIKYEMTMDKGVKFYSASDKWKEGNLLDLSKDFLKNTHGDEINYLDYVILIPNEEWPKEVEYARGFYKKDNTEVTLSILLNNYLREPIFQKKQKKGFIALRVYNYSNANKDILRTLSHEYGHHFTMYYSSFFPYYKTNRNLKDEEKARIYQGNDYEINHLWDIQEIAAEDYVQLMGYYDKEIKDFYDAKQEIILYADKRIKVDNDWNSNTLNVYPQENPFIPLAYEVAGLKDFYLSFIGETANEERTSATTPIVIHSKKIANKQWEITWTPAEVNDSDILYTLVLHSANNTRDPIKTVKGGNDLQAILLNGTMDYKNFTFTKKFKNSDVYLKVYAIYPDGFIASSEPYHMDISK